MEDLAGGAQLLFRCRAALREPVIPIAFQLAFLAEEQLDQSACVLDRLPLLVRRRRRGLGWLAPAILLLAPIVSPLGHDAHTLGRSWSRGQHAV